MHGQHRFTGAPDLAEDILDQQIGDIFGNGDPVAIFIDLLFLGIPVFLFGKPF